MMHAGICRLSFAFLLVISALWACGQSSEEIELKEPVHKNGSDYEKVAVLENDLFTTNVGDVLVWVEVAQTPKAQEQGLMFREYLDLDDGYVMQNLLIIERDPQFREAYKSMLRRAGFRVIVKPDIVDGLQMLKGLRRDLIVWNLHPKNVIEIKALSVLRERYGNIPLVVNLPQDYLSDFPTEMAEAVLSKSTKIEVLREKIVELLEDRVPIKNES